MSGNLEEKLTDNSEAIIKTDLNAKLNKQIVFTQPKQAPTDPWYCLCCLFCFEACNWLSAGGPSVQYSAHNKRQSHKNYWGHNVTADDDDDGVIVDDYEWGSMFANQIIGVKDHSKDNDDHNDGEGNDNGGDGGDGGGGDGGGGGGE